MKIGDKVRFLSETGGGKISGFQGKNIVLVEDEDGFEIPTPISEVVLVGNEDLSKTKIVHLEQHETEQTENKNMSIKAQLAIDSNTSTHHWAEEEEPDYDPSDNFVAPVKEREGGDALAVYLAFVPKNIKQIGNTDFSAYLVNDSNYYIHYIYMVGEEEKWAVKSVGEIEPNTKLFIEEFGYEDLNGLVNSCVQLFAYKQDKSFALKPALDVRLKIDGTKFYKLNTFRENDFFDEPALLYPILEPAKNLQKGTEDAVKMQSDALQPNHLNALKAALQPARRPIAPISENNSEQRKKVKQILKDDKIVIDLHIDSLLETTVGMSASDILDYQMTVFRNLLEEYRDRVGQKLIFIHGKGEGVLRNAIIRELNYRYKKHQYQDASFQEYGYGATQVTIRKA